MVGYEYRIECSGSCDNFNAHKQLWNTFVTKIRDNEDTIEEDVRETNVRKFLEVTDTNLWILWDCQILLMKWYWMKKRVTWPAQNIRGGWNSLLTKLSFLLVARFCGTCDKNPFRIFHMKFHMKDSHEWKNVSYDVLNSLRTWGGLKFVAHKVILLSISPFLRNT